jgi:lipopolysaccharide transport system ATP-binding protein
MSEIAIQVEELGKRYVISHQRANGDGLRHILQEKLTSPLRWFRNKERHSIGQVNSGSEEFWALKDVSFEIKQGEVVGIIGRNGAGKSTLLKILSRITEPTNGRITIEGRVASLLEVGTGFHPELTGRENIFLNGAILGMTRADIKREFDSIVDFAETERFLDTPVKRYSSGMYVRLAFAVAAHLKPNILVVDEVLAVGDLGFQRKCLGKMDEIAHQRGATVLFVSHQMAAIRSLCSRAILLDRGTVDTIGEIESVMSRYLAMNRSELAATTSLPPGEPDSPVHATALHALDMEGQPCTTFRLGEPWRARLEFEVHQPMAHVIAAIGLRNAEGVPLITWWSAPRDLTPGIHNVEFTCDVPFCAGEINFAVGISAGERAHYYVENTGAVMISEIAIGKQPFRPSGAGAVISTQRPEIL